MLSCIKLNVWAMAFYTYSYAFHGYCKHNQGEAMSYFRKNKTWSTNRMYQKKLITTFPCCLISWLTSDGPLRQWIQTLKQKGLKQEVNCHHTVFLTACSWAKQLLSPGTHSTFIRIMEKETQFGRCFSGVQRGTLILAQITAALHGRVFWSLYPSGQVSLRGGV